MKTLYKKTKRLAVIRAIYAFVYPKAVREYDEDLTIDVLTRENGWSDVMKDWAREYNPIYWYLFNGPDIERETSFKQQLLESKHVLKHWHEFKGFFTISALHENWYSGNLAATTTFRFQCQDTLGNTLEVPMPITSSSNTLRL